MTRRPAPRRTESTRLPKRRVLRRRVNSQRLWVEMLEVRALLAVTAIIEAPDNTLRITGGSENNHIVVEVDKGAKLIQVSEGSSLVNSFAISSVGKILLDSGAGNDFVNFVRSDVLESRGITLDLQTGDGDDGVVMSSTTVSPGAYDPLRTIPTILEPMEQITAAMETIVASGQEAASHLIEPIASGTHLQPLHDRESDVEALAARIEDFTLRAESQLEALSAADDDSTDPPDEAEILAITDQITAEADALLSDAQILADSLESTMTSVTAQFEQDLAPLLLSADETIWLQNLRTEAENATGLLTQVSSILSSVIALPASIPIPPPPGPAANPCPVSIVNAWADLGGVDFFFPFNTNVSWLILGLGGNDLLFGGNQADLIFGGFGNDLIFGMGGNDDIRGEVGNDLLFGDSWFDLTVNGHDCIQGGFGVDLVIGDNIIDSGVIGGNDPVLRGGDQSDIVIGDDFQDFLTGNTNGGQDTMSGGDGTDVVHGAGGNDTIEGNEDFDLLIGGGGNDTTYASNNTYLFDPNTVASVQYGDNLWGVQAAGNDTMYGANGGDLIFGQGGSDTLQGDNEIPILFVSFDALFGEEGNDTINGGSQPDLIVGGEGADTLAGDSNLSWQPFSHDQMWGGCMISCAADLGDVMDGGNGIDAMRGQFGNDTMTGDNNSNLLANSNDWMRGGPGDDWMDGGSNRDKMFGDDDCDTMFGDDGDFLKILSLDFMSGGAGCDEMYGGTGIDMMFGDDGSDLMHGQRGLDTMAGGDGTDLMFGEEFADIIGGGDQSDQIHGEDGDDILVGNDGNDCLFGDFGSDFISGGSGNDCIRAGDNGAIIVDLVLGNDGDDNISGEDGKDWIFGNDGNDVIYGGEDRDRLWGNGGDDTIEGENESDWLFGGNGNDKLFGGPGNEAVILLGFPVAPKIFGGPGNDDGFGGTGTDMQIGVENWDTNGADTNPNPIPPCTCEIIAACKFDFGDAPNFYGTINGPNHGIFPVLGPILGATADKEPNGQPSASALDDDNNGSPDDEDGVLIPSPLVRGLPMQIFVTVSNTNNINTQAFLDAWIDYDGVSGFSAGPLGPFEQIATALPVNVGVNVLNISVPWTAAIGTTYARFRVSTNPSGLSPNSGSSNDGEIEDYAVTIVQGTDWGDLPDPPYATLGGSNGPRHDIVQFGPRLGSRIDHESNGQPTPLADGDDTTGNPDDEDGVTTSTLFAGQTSLFPFTITNLPNNGTAYVNAWVDFFNPSGFGLGEQVATNMLVSNGSYNLNIPTPVNAVPGLRCLRVRVSTTQNLGPSGPASNGEVEDYCVLIQPPGLDYGDAPDPTYPTLLANNGARHAIVPFGPRLGTNEDQEPDGQPSAGADQDDTTGTPDDEDGVAPVTGALGNIVTVVAGFTTTLTITRTGNAGFLNAWIDFDGDGGFGTGPLAAFEQIATNMFLPVNVNSLTFLTPAAAATTNPNNMKYARFRVSTANNLGPSGFAPDGEVEDYKVVVEERRDFGDCNTTGQTILPSGASHQLGAGAPRMGAAITDDEPNGTNSPLCDYDDLNYATPDDEDGVIFTQPVIAGANNNTVVVNLGSTPPARLDAWIDLDNNLVFGNTAAEHIIINQVLNNQIPNPNTLTFAVPMTGVTLNQPLNARFRVHTNPGGLTPIGPGGLGEVEDHRVTIVKKYDFGDAITLNGQTFNANPNAPTAAHHDINGPRLGTAIDDEFNGQPTPGADGDDNAGTPDDEDGVTLPNFNIMAIGGSYAIPVVLSNAPTAFLNVWLDSDNNQVFTAGELVSAPNVVITMANNPNQVIISVPPTATFGPHALRFRVYNSSQPNPQPDGYGGPGEVEDYMVVLESLNDWGDAFPPQTSGALSQTMFPNGARHVADGLRPTLGPNIDIEPGGQPSALANLDDNTNSPDDEDGVVMTPLLIGGTVNVTVNVTGASVANPVWLNAWVDYNGNNYFDSSGPNELVANLALTTASNSVPITIPNGYSPGQCVARFRVSRAPFTTLPPDGPGGPGEVEDHLCTMTASDADYGDLPQSYQTLFNANPVLSGPYHSTALNAPVLGPNIDVEANGAPSALANGDDTTGIADENGITITSIFGGSAGSTIPCFEAGATVNLNAFLSGAANAYLDAWVDFNSDGDYLADPSDNIFIAQALINANNPLSFVIPANAFSTNPAFTYLRFRVSTNNAGLPFWGPGGLGEVEDYQYCVQRPTPPAFDFGDAPDVNYQTLSGSNGASHTITFNSPVLGMLVDSESNGAPSANADGDDTTGSDDEDGITITSITFGAVATIPCMAPGTLVNFDAVLSNAAVAGLDVWIDLNTDGDFTDPGENVLSATPINTGLNSLSFVIPNAATLANPNTYLRYRVSPLGGLPSNGFGGLGEVEDYVHCTQPRPRPPVDLFLSETSVRENQPPGTFVGELFGIDEDPGDVLTYSLIDGPGGEDNRFFQIIGNVLTTAAVFDFDERSTYTVVVRVTDSYGLFLDNDTRFVINVLPVTSMGDLNGDGSVDAADAGIMFGNWGGSGIGDINGDGIVDAADAGIVFGEWTGDALPGSWEPDWLQSVSTDIARFKARRN